MTGYRRFVAYVYEYQKGKKGRNCGFIRVEAREKRCRTEVRLNCPGPAAGSAVRDLRVCPQGRPDGRKPSGYLCHRRKPGGMRHRDGPRPHGGGRDISGTDGRNDPHNCGRRFFCNGMGWTVRCARNTSGGLKREKNQREKPRLLRKRKVPMRRESLNRRKKTPESRGKKWIRRKKQAPEPGRKWKRRKPAAGAPEEDYDPFEDGEFAECRKIMPEDLCCLHPADRSLKGNRSPPVRLSGFRAPASGKNRVGQVLPGSAGSIRPAGKIHGGDVRFSLFQIQPPYSSGEGERRLLVPPNQCPGSPQDRWFLSGCSGRRRSSSAEKLLNPGCRTSSESLYAWR